MGLGCNWIGWFYSRSASVAYLESPGKPYDGEDNDDDGIIDEQRDNPAGSLVGPYDNITDLTKFLDFYNLKEKDLREHFERDEDQDWQDGVDLNGDGNYSYFNDQNQTWFIDEGESPGDDVGLDGVSPMDLNYNGPDEGECNHNPILKKAIEVSFMEYYAFPYEYIIVFTGNDSAYVNRLNKKTGINSLGVGDPSNSEEPSFLFDQAFSFYVTNQTALDVLGKLDTLELIVVDLNGNGVFDIIEDKVLVGHTVIRTLGSNKLISWGGTVFAIDFRSVTDVAELPKAGDIYKYEINRPFSESDSIEFIVNGAIEVEEGSLNETMEDIKVVPNPYIMTNSMEPAVGNKFLNQRRRLLFTHIPAECIIRIFTSSGILVDKIEVDNEPSDGTVHWDLLSREDLEIAAGIYIYHIKSNVTGNEKIGKFAVIK